MEKQCENFILIIRDVHFFVRSRWNFATFHAELRLYQMCNRSVVHLCSTTFWNWLKLIFFGTKMIKPGFDTLYFMKNGLLVGKWVASPFRHLYDTNLQKDTKFNDRCFKTTNNLKELPHTQQAINSSAYTHSRNCS